MEKSRIYYFTFMLFTSVSIPSAFALECHVRGSPPKRTNPPNVERLLL